jgi:hypothetical protein
MLSENFNVWPPQLENLTKYLFDMRAGDCECICIIRFDKRIAAPYWCGSISVPSVALHVQLKLSPQLSNAKRETKWRQENPVSMAPLFKKTAKCVAVSSSTLLFGKISGSKSRDEVV